MSGFVDLHDATVERAGGVLRQTTQLRYQHDKLPATSISYELDEAWASWVRPGPEALLPSALVLAARLGDDLRVDQPIHPAVRAAVLDAHALQAAWWGWRPARLVAPEGRVRPPRRGRARGLFFTSGVDSWGALLTLRAGPRRHAPTHLLTVDGETHLDDGARRRSVALVAEAAEHLGLPHVVVRTDLRTAIDPHTEWGRHTHAGALAGVAHLLAGGLRTATLGATNWWPDATPYGSHPGLDPRWSVPWLTIDHRGADESRHQRVVRVAGHPEAAARLQVCWQGSTASNCGACSKCVHTLTNLHLSGHHGWEDRFQLPFDPDRILAIPAVSAAVRNGMLEHCDQVGLGADAIRQRWEGRAIAPLDRDDYRFVEPHRRVRVVDLEGRALEPAAALVVGRALAPLGLRLDHGVDPARQEPADPVVALAATAAGVHDAEGRDLAAALAALGVRTRPDRAFDPDGQPPAVAGWTAVRQAELSWTRAGSVGPPPPRPA